MILVRASLWFSLVTAVSAVDFSREIYPMLQRSCLECHGAHEQKAGLRLDQKPAGKELATELLRRVQLPAADKDAMPKRGARLKPAEIKALSVWVAEGAPWPAQIQPRQHWAYVAPQRPALPAVKQSKQVRNGVDAFLFAKLEEEQAGPLQEAEAARLYRRLCLDLTGLPPSVAEVDAYLKAPDYEQAVDRLLGSKEFGVRWARPWLDLARYADSHGFQRDDLRSIWGYRDWVVNALNAGMGFDQFTIEQIAGDLLPGATEQQRIATGFHRCTPTNVEAGTEPEESRVNQVIDRVNTTGTVWLGSTLECAQCHNHKYDPFTQKDYYQLLAYYNNTQKEAERSNAAVPGSIRFLGAAVKMRDDQQAAARAELEAKLKALHGRMESQRQKLGLKEQPQPLVATELSVESGSEAELLPDGSYLFRGEPPDTDVYHFEATLEAGPLSGVLIEALAHPELLGGGPGRPANTRPNFVLQQLAVTLDGKPLSFQEAYASFSQRMFDVRGLIDADSSTGWAINPEFKKSHWAAFELTQPVEVKAGAKLRLSLVQEFGAGRSIGCLRISRYRNDVSTSLPETAGAQSPVMVEMQKQRQALEKQLAALVEPTSEVMLELPEPRMSSIFKRGEYTQPGEAVTAGTPAVLAPQAKGPPSRLTLARWLVSRQNPLTARVTVNRWWAELMGQGIVTTQEDFGIKGEPPTHPELLDWLACEFMDSGWSMKHVIKLIVMSHGYRQARSSDAPPVLYAQGPRFRMDAEMIRDNALSIAGLLSLKQGGEPIRPPQPEGLWRKVGGQQYNYQVSPGTEQYRRGLYVVLKRGAPYPSFMNFDASARMACVVRRSRSNTPLQALTLLNDPVYVEAAQSFAQRVVRECSGSTPEQLRYAFRLAVARQPSVQELQVLQSLYQAQLSGGKTPQQAMAAVCTALLNLDECITKG
jgi:hypothetical protein